MQPILTVFRLTPLASALLWMLASRTPWLLDIVTNVGLLVLTVLCGYWLLWHGRRVLFNGLVKADGKCVLITGCDTGFGHMLATQLAEEGFFVYAGCLDENGEGAKLLRRSENMLVMQMDVTKEEEVDCALQTVENTIGEKELWAVVANAGVGTLGYIEWQPMSRIRSVFDVNTFGTLSVCTTFLPLVKKARGRLILVTSQMGRITMPECLTYCMSKVACTSLADGLRRQYFNRGVRVCTVEPSGYRTPIVDHVKLEEIFDRDIQLLPESVRSAINGRSVVRCKHTADVLHSLMMNERTQDAVDAMKLAIRERLPRACYRPGGLRDCLLQWLHDIAPIEIADEVIDALRRVSLLMERK